MKIKAIFVIPFLFFATNWFADVNCPKAKIQHLQPQTNSILVRQEGQDWHKIGDVNDPGAQAMYSALLAAQMAGKPVVIRYPDGYVCSAYETQTHALVVRTYNE